jgi:hypothetical protein
MGNAGYGNHTEDTPHSSDPQRPGTDVSGLPSNATQPGGAPKGTEEPGGKAGGSGDVPPAGPHADPALINNDATPGTGALTPPGEHDDVDSTSS